MIVPKLSFEVNGYQKLSAHPKQNRFSLLFNIEKKRIFGRHGLQFVNKILFFCEIYFHSNGWKVYQN